MVAEKKTTDSKQTKKKRQLKQAPVSVREKASKAANSSRKPRKVKRAKSALARPFRAIFRLMGRILRPFRFVLRPFKTRPARAIGRFLASVLLLRYVRNSWKELRQVTWPDARTTAKLTFAVFVFALFLTGVISAVDHVLGEIFEKVIIN